MSKNHDSGQVSRALGWGLLLGGGVGLTVGFLFAPEEGSRLRRRVKFHLDELTKQVGSLAESIKSSGENDGAKSKSKGEALVAKATEQAQEINSQMEEIMHSAVSTRSESE